jgi:hypothetical protein
MQADKYYLAARLLILDGCLIDPFAYCARQALEMYLKGLTIKEVGEYLDGHDLSVLYNNLVSINGKFNKIEIKEAIDKFNRYNEFRRYPEGKDFPGSDVIGTDNLDLLDEAVFCLRNLISTPKGIDTLISGTHDGLPPRLRQRKILVNHNKFYESFY